jgi:hypothetical protein
MNTWINNDRIAFVFIMACMPMACTDSEPTTPIATDAAIDQTIDVDVDALVDLEISVVSDATVADIFLNLDGSLQDQRITDRDLVDAIVPDGGVIDAATPVTLDCLNEGFVGIPSLGPQYGQFSPTMGSHCSGTNHQSIVGVERVVFVGDSVTVGTPPADPMVYYRYLLAMQLADHFGLQPPDWTWAQVNLLEGVSLSQEAGDFASCARWGARTDDLLADNTLLTNCVPESQRSKKTLFVMTMGGNDISNLTQDGLAGASTETLWAQTEGFVALMRAAARWIKNPANFPNGAYLVFANMFEFTDGTGDVTACPAAGIAGFGAEWEDPDLLANLVIWANEQYMDIAVESQTDMIFMLEQFCGHGFNHAQTDAPCYRGPNAQNWFDLTCIHPNELGHRAIADAFFKTITQ